MSIERLTGSAIGRNRVVGYENLVFTVATAGAPAANLAEQTQLTLAQLDQNLADAGSDKSCILSATVYITDITQEGLTNTELVASDNLHPSTLAYTRFVQRILPIALEILD